MRVSSAVPFMTGCQRDSERMDGAQSKATGTQSSRMWTTAAGPAALPGPGSMTSSCRADRARRGTLSGVLGVLLVVVACLTAPHLLRSGSPSGVPSPGPVEDAPSPVRRSPTAPPAQRRSQVRLVSGQVPEDQLSTCTEKFTAEEVMEHGSSDDCWMVIHGKVLDITAFIPKHPGGESKFEDEEGMLLCGTDVTGRFMAQHGALSDLLSRVNSYKNDIMIVGELDETEVPLPPSSLSGGPESYDFSETPKQPHPGNGQEFKTLVYIELKGAWDGASGFVNIKEENEIHLWCSKRPTLSAAEYCECSTSVEEGETCDKYVLKTAPGDVREGNDCWRKLYSMRNTDGYLAMTDLLACGETGWMPLWDSGKMSIVPGVGRRDGKRSHFLVKDAAAKGVSVQLEQTTRNGWLGKSIFAYNNLYCKPGETPCPPSADADPEPTIDGISFAQAAAGPDALMVSQTIAETGTFNHLSGVQDVTEVAEGGGFNYVTPFQGDGLNRRMGPRDIAHNFGYYDDATRQQTVKLRERTDEELWAEAVENPGLSELLLKEQTLFESLGILKDQLTGLKAQINEGRVCGGNFPDIREWADSSSSAEIGMQLYAVAVLLANGVYPKVYQVQQKRFDTHANQGSGVKKLLADLKTGVFTFVKAAEVCGFFDKILVSTFTDFGRRLEENSRQGTDHGWGTYNMVFGTNLKDQIYGNSQNLGEIIPWHRDCYDTSKDTKGNLLMTYDIETYNACLLNALALPALPRLGSCPPQLRFREGLNTIPTYNEEEFYGAVSGEGGGRETVLPGDSDSTHLHTPLTRTEILHFSRRVGYSTKSLGLDAYAMPGLGGGPAKTDLTLQQAISMVLSEENIARGQSPPRPRILDFVNRQVQWTLFTEETRKKQNNWKILQALPYPRYDTIRRRLRRFDIEKYFDLSSLTVNQDKPSDPWFKLLNGRTHQDALAAGDLNFIELKNEYLSNVDWDPQEILRDLQRTATDFFWPKVMDGEDGRAVATKDLLPGSNAIRNGKVDWYQTIMMVPDVVTLSDVTTEDVIDDWTCECSNENNLNTCFNPKDKWDPGATPCNPTCDFNELFIIDKSAQTAMLRDTRSPDSTRESRQQQVGWWVLKECVNLRDGTEGYGKIDAEKGRIRFESSREIGENMQDDLYQRFFDDFTNPEFGLRSRMTWFFLNMYAVPGSGNSWQLMSKMYDTIWRGALGNYRLLSRAMFKDGALRKSLDQLEEAPCDQAPIENFAREWFERFTVGLNGHNEGDVKKLSKALMNCRESTETFNEDLVRPGVIFQNPEEAVWTATEAEEIAVVDRILDYSHMQGEPPMAAQFLCGNLYKEFAIFPEVPEASSSASSIGYAPEVVDCATHLYDHNYDVKFALEYIFQDKIFFREGLGKKKRWPLAVVLGHMTDFTMKFSNDVKKLVDVTASVGMRPFEPQDVSGFSLENVWTLDRLQKMHAFLESWVQPAITDADQSANVNRLTKRSLNDRLTFLGEAAPYALSGEDFGKFGFNTQLCGPDFFVDQVGSQGENVVDVDVLFELKPNGKLKNSWARRWQIWKASVEYTITNVCQFVC